MFSAITSYIWGPYEETNEENKTTVPVTCETNETLENDWILIKPKDYGNETRRIRRARFHEDAASTASDSSAMEDSWLVTPAQGFIKRDKNCNMCPLENLLIEHPSMSIYKENEDEEKEKQQEADEQAKIVAKQNSEHRALAGRLQLLEERTPLKDLNKKNQDKKSNTPKATKQKNRVYVRQHNARKNKQYGRMSGKHTAIVAKRGN